MNRLILLTVCLFLVGCSTLSKRTIIENTDPNESVTLILEKFATQIRGGNACHVLSHKDAYNDCEGILRETMQLYSSFPSNERVQLLSAYLFYHGGRKEQASFLLDQLLQSNKPRPEAAIIRSRIALEDGNTKLAKKLMKQQIRLNPTVPSLHETLASAYYFEENYKASEQALIRAEQFGAPQWRISFHRGLVFKNQGKKEAACLQFINSIRINPSFLLPASHIFSLSEVPVCEKFNPVKGV